MASIRRIIKRKRRGGRDPYPRARPVQAPNGVYLPDSLQLVTLIGSMGATDEEIEKVYGLGQGTLEKWRKFYPSLDKALEQGRTRADIEVLHAAFKAAVGYHEYEEQAVGGREPRVMKVKRYYPGQHLAQKYWMSSRQREKWPASDRVEVTGRNGEPIKVENRNDVIDAILKIVTSKPDMEKEKPQKEQRAE